MSKINRTQADRGREIHTRAFPTECQHHYVFPTPNGPTVTGKCKKCGAEKTSPVWLETYEFSPGSNHRGYSSRMQQR